MGLIKCPRCELNYMLDTEKMCSVCKRDVRGESEQDEMVELCSECGENPVVPGQELCAYCLKELSQRDSDTQSEETVVTDTSTIAGIDSVSTMDEIELDLNEDMGDESFAEDDDGFFGDDDDDEDDEDDMSGEDR